MLVTGASGMLGQDLCPILENAGYYVIRTDRETLDITNEKVVNELISKAKPDLIIHTAAYTNVELAETEVKKAFLINETGTKNVAKAAEANNSALLYISTDYVFDGKKTGKYAPQDPPNPLNVYGQSKLAGETIVRELCEKYYIIRTSWLYGEYGKNFVDTMLTLATKSELKVVSDQRGCPTWTVKLAQGILNILNKPYGIYHICGGGEASWYEFAKEIFKQKGLKVNLLPCVSSEYPQKAKRPKNSMMESSMPSRNWKEALREYLSRR